MNINKRISRLEAKSNVKAEFCRCNGDAEIIETIHHDITYNAYQTGEYVPYQHSKQALADAENANDDEFEIEICPNCRKPINKRFIVLCVIRPPEGWKHFHDTPLAKLNQL